MAEKKLKITDLNELYSDGESVDSELFAEMRTNLRFVAGEHYTKKGSTVWNRVRDYQRAVGDNRIRITKNHSQRISKILQNKTLAMCPGVAPFPKNPTELSDKKAAELNKAVWQDLKDRKNLRERQREFCGDYVDIGECIAKVYFDPNAGDFVGYMQAVDENGQPQEETDEFGRPTGNLVPDMGRPVFRGDIAYERIMAFNLLRDPKAKHWDDCEWVCYRKMAPVKVLKAQYHGDKERLDMIEESSEDTYVVFDSQTGKYGAAKGQTMIREFYFRPSACYPKGYFYITTEKGILHEGELPGGFFPIVQGRWDDITNTPRARAVHKHLRPAQMEVNRCASQIALTQMTVGDDKVLIQNGTKLQPGATMPGIRTATYSGATPIIVAGRDGGQYLNSLDSAIKEMYELANISDPQDAGDDKAPQADPYGMLFSAVKDKARFSLQAERFEEFWRKVCVLSLEMARFYYEADRIIPAIGKAEAINIPEFKNAGSLHYQIKLEPQTDDVESKLGKHLVFNHVIQYVGNQLPAADIGKLLRHMPYANHEGVTDDLTMDYDNATNDILALDRGQYRPAKRQTNHEYMIMRLNNRMAKSDYEFLPAEVQGMYEAKLAEHEKMFQEQMQAAERAKAGFIPTGGYGVKVDVYQPDQDGKLKRAVLPQESVMWLMQKLVDQGQTEDALARMPLASVENIAARLAPGEVSPDQADMGPAQRALGLV